MKAYRVTLTSWTASFRYPNLISGFQPSLPVPPLSTVYGVLSAAAGSCCTAFDFPVGYLFRYGAVYIDLETIYMVRSKGRQATSNVTRRQILFDNTLWLYLTDRGAADAFRKPWFQLLLGRSGDLATVEAIDEVTLEPRERLSRLKGTLVPLGPEPMSAPIQALPVGFSTGMPRRNLGTRPFFMLEYDYEQPREIEGRGYYDAELQHEIYWHDYTGWQAGAEES